MKPWALCVLLLLPYLASGIRIVSEYKDVNIVDGIPYSQSTVTVECDGGPDFDVPHLFTIQSDSGDTHNMTVTCRFPEQHYDVYKWGYVPADGRHLSVEMCTIRDFGRFADANRSESQEVFGSDPTGRSLLAFEEDSDCEERTRNRRSIATAAATGAVIGGFSAIGAPIGALIGAAIGGAFRTPKCSIAQSDAFNSLTGGSISLVLVSDAKRQGTLGFPNTNPAPWIGGAVKDAMQCVGTSNMKSASGTNCFTGPTAQTLTNLKQTVDSLALALNTFGETQIQRQSAVSDAVGNFTLSLTNLKSVGESLNTTVAGLLLDAFSDFRLQQSLDKQAKEGVAANYERLSNVSSLTIANANNAVAFANATGTNFEIIAAYGASVNANISSAFLQRDEIVLRNQILTHSQIREAQRYLNNLKTILRRWYLDEDMRNGLSIQTHSALEDPLVYTGSTGSILTPFLVDLGVRPGDPNALNPLYATLLTSDDSVKYVTADNQYGVITRFQLMCESEFMATRAPMNPSVNEVARLLGPIGCDTTGESDVLLKCQCFVRVTETRCRVNGPLSQSQQSSFDQDALQLVVGNGCISSPVSFTNATGGMDGFVLSDVSALADAFGKLSQRGVSSGTQYAMASILPGIRIQAQWSQAVSDPSNFMRLLVGEFVSSELNNLVFGYFKNVQSSYAVAYNNLGYIQSLVYGRLPKDMKQKQVLYRRFKQGRTGRCTTLSAMLYSDELLLVSSLVPSQIITNVEVIIDGQQTIVSDVSFESPMRKLLPKKAIVWSPGQFNTRLWDVPEREISLSPRHFGRKNKITYALCGDRAACDLQAWMQDNGRGLYEFDHDAGKNLPPPYEADVDSDPNSITYGRCITTPKAPGGKLCSMRNHFQVFATGNFEDSQTPGTMIFVDRNPVYTVTLAVPEGAIVEVLSSVCPLIQEIATSGTLLLIELINPLNSSNIIRVREVGGCPKTTSITLGPAASEIYQASSCALPNTLRIDYLSGTTYVSCPTEIDLSFTPETLASFQGAASLNLTYSIQVQKRDEIMLAIEKQRIELANAIMLASNEQLLREKDLGFDIPPLTLLLYKDLYDKSRQVADDAARRVKQISESGISAEDIIAEMEAQAEISKRRFEDDIARIKDAQERFDGQQETNANQLVFVRVANELAEDAFVDAVGNMTKFWASMLFSINSSVQEDPRSKWTAYDLESSSRDGGADAAGAWSRVGDFFTRTFGSSESGIGGFISKLFGNPLELVGNLFASSGSLAALGWILLVVLFIIMIPLLVYGGYKLISWANRPRVYEGDIEAKVEIRRNIEALRYRIQNL